MALNKQSVVQSEYGMLNYRTKSLSTCMVTISEKDCSSMEVPIAITSLTLPPLPCSDRDVRLAVQGGRAPRRVPPGRQPPLRAAVAVPAALSHGGNTWSPAGNTWSPPGHIWSHLATAGHRQRPTRDTRDHHHHAEAAPQAAAAGVAGETAAEQELADQGCVQIGILNTLF